MDITPDLAPVPCHSAKLRLLLMPHMCHAFATTMQRLCHACVAGCYISNISVLEKYRRQGIARALVKKLIRTGTAQNGIGGFVDQG